jgi:hypothetical protein
VKTSSGMKEYIESQKIDAAIRHGHEICHAHYPPAVMTSEDDVNWTCPECGNTRYTGISVGTLPI